MMTHAWWQPSAIVIFGGVLAAAMWIWTTRAE